MEFVKNVKDIFTKVLSVGKPSDNDVLYSKVIQREIPKESAEALTLKEIKETVTQLFHREDTPLEEISESSKAVPITPTKKATPSKKAATKKPVAKKSVVKKTTEKKTTIKKPAVKKSPSKKPVAKKVIAPKGEKKAAKIALYIKDIKKHYGEVDEDFVAIIVKNLGPSIYKKDAELVSCSDPKELDTVRKSFLIKKLGMDESQAVLDVAIADVCQELKSARTKYRATFYYALAKKFKKESVLS